MGGYITALGKTLIFFIFILRKEELDSRFRRFSLIDLDLRTPGCVQTVMLSYFLI